MNVVKNERINVERLIEERIKSNTKLFNKEDIGSIIQNMDLVSKIYVLGLLDSYNFWI